MDEGSPIKQMVAANLATLDPACDGPPKPVLAKPFDLRSSIGRAHRPGLLAKKSRSTVSWPILA